MKYIEKHRIAWKDCKTESDFRAYENEKKALEQCRRNAHSLQEDFTAAGLIELLPKLNALIDDIYAARDAYEADENAAIKASWHEDFPDFAVFASEDNSNAD